MVVTINPTSVTTPDPGQGGLSVTGATVTGHGSTTAAANLADPFVLKTCKWTGLSNILSGLRISVTLKLNWTEDGFCSPPDSDNDFGIDYSLDGGSNWITALLHSDVTSPSSGSLSISLPRGQDISLVQVRDFMDAIRDTINANITISIDSIRVEVNLADSPLLVMM
jgi:hypothetical protein